MAVVDGMARVHTGTSHECYAQQFHLMQKLDVSTLAKIACVGIEEMIRHNASETGVLIDAAGATVIKRHGQANRITLTHLELSRAAGMTFTHNHPNGTGPSLADVQLGIEYGLKEVRVVTEKYRHGVEMLLHRMASPLDAGFANAEATAKVAIREAIRLGSVHPHDFSVETRHRTWQMLSSAIGFHYWRHES